MTLLVIIMILAFILSVVSGISFYYKHTKPEQKALKQRELNNQDSYFDSLNELAKNKEITKQDRIEIVHRLAEESAANLTAQEADERIEMIWKFYRNNVFKEQLSKSFFAVPHLFRIQSTRIFMDEMAELNDDIEAREIADVLADFEAITTMIYVGSHNWDSSRVQAHLQAIEEQLPTKL